VVKTIVDLMMGSRETFVNYTMPLGLHHLIGGDHYAPQPQNNQAQRRDWTATYYHQADANGIGFERTRAPKGNDAVDQYFKPLSDQFNDVATCPDKFLLWFHHLPWDFKMKSGKTLWTELVEHYDRGVVEARAMQKTWADLKGKIDERRHTEVANRLTIQVTDSLAWRNQILGYFSGINKLPVPNAPA
jgi:alpha-glucuronidase